MTNRERMIKTLGRDRDLDRLPMIEWVDWWEPTLARWQTEDPACPSGREAVMRFFGLDPYHHYWPQIRCPGIPVAPVHGAPIFRGEDQFRREILPYLFDESHLEPLRQALLLSKPLQDSGEIFVWYTLEGFFWFPRTLFGIENHLYAFYDEPELMHEMNDRLADFHLKTLEVIYDVLRPEFMTFAEDLSYNHGPMIGKDSFDEFLLPYYRRVIPAIQAQGTPVFIDTDGFVEPLIPWFRQAGVQGILPLERQAGVDVSRIRREHPDFLMLGGYDKTLMHLGEAAMRGEFERLLPVMRDGGYIPAVDHQTPPDVDIHQYRLFVQLLKEYGTKAVQS